MGLVIDSVQKVKLKNGCDFYVHNTENWCTSGQIPKICSNETKEICILLIVILASWPILSDLGVSAGGILLPSQHV